MDREPKEMQFLGIFDIYIESYKIIISYRKLFSQITIALILPLSFIFLASIEIHKLLFSEIIRNDMELHRAPLSVADRNKIVDLVSSEKVTLRLFKFFYLTLSLAFSLVSTSAIVYTIASIYTGRDVSFTKVVSVVPKVWKRLIVTFQCAIIAFFLYHVFSTIIFVLSRVAIGSTNTTVPSLLIFLISYIPGMVYLAVVWQLASVLSVLEDCYGFEAMRKSKELVKGKVSIAVVIFLKLVVSAVVIVSLFERLVVHAQSHSLISRIGIGFLCLLLLSKLLLFALVAHTVIYFVCKSYHNENIDKPMLSDHLDVYLGDYVPLKAKDVQLEQLHV